jgi:inositol oxygenase
VKSGVGFNRRGNRLRLSRLFVEISIQRTRFCTGLFRSSVEGFVMVDSTGKTSVNAPLSNLDEWEDDLLRRYPNPDHSAREVAAAGTNSEKKQEEFRNYTSDARSSVKEFYRLNHTHQTVDFVRRKRAEYLSLNKRQMGAWDAMEVLNRLTDDSDPDTDVPQIEHSLQTLLAIRRDGHPRWFQLVGLIHDLGKVLCLFDEPQWAVVGDTFPVGCRFSEKIVYPEFFNDNPDRQFPEYQTQNGLYEEGAGLDKVLMSWGHDEYLYNVVKDYLPEEALYMIRYHSFYAAHREGEYDHLMNERDREGFRWVRAFNPYDLYSKSTERPNVDELRPYCEALLEEYLPSVLRW